MPHFAFSISGSERQDQYQSWVLGKTELGGISGSLGVGAAPLVEFPLAIGRVGLPCLGLGGASSGVRARLSKTCTGGTHAVSSSGWTFLLPLT